jgi:hypothetical protein
MTIFLAEAGVDHSPRRPPDLGEHTRCLRGVAEDFRQTLAE